MPKSSQITANTIPNIFSIKMKCFQISLSTSCIWRLKWVRNNIFFDKNSQNNFSVGFPLLVAHGIAMQDCNDHQKGKAYKEKISLGGCALLRRPQFTVTSQRDVKPLKMSGCSVLLPLLLPFLLLPLLLLLLFLLFPLPPLQVCSEKLFGSLTLFHTGLNFSNFSTRYSWSMII